MRVLVAGPRHSHITAHAVADALDRAPYEITELVHGGASGVDSYAATWAAIHGVAVKVFKPRYDLFRNKRSAPPARNEKMVAYADAAIILWDGRSAGTKDVLRRVVTARLPLVLRVIPSALDAR